MGSRNTEDARPEGTAQTPDTTTDGGSGYHHLVDIRLTTPRVRGVRRYFVLRMGRDIRGGPRPHTVPPRVQRRNRTVAALLVQMVLAWFVALLLLFAWLSQMGCGAQVAGGDSLEGNGAPGAALTEDPDASPAPEGSVRAGPVLAVTPTTLNFGTTTVSMNIALRNSGTGTLTWQAAGQAPQVTVSPLSGTNAATVKVVVSRTGLSPGVHQYLVRLTSNGGAISVPVTISVAAPGISVLPATLNYGAKVVSMALTIRGLGGAVPAWTATRDHTWVTLGATAGTSPATLVVRVDRSKLAVGSYTSAVRVKSVYGTAVITVKATVGTGGIDVGVS
jgi:hypothetical protein